MIGKKINQLATELAPVSTDLTIIGDPTTGVSKKITLAQLGAIFSGAVSFYTNLAGFPAVGDINVIYCAKDTKKLYLWSGTAYVEVFPSQALLDTYQLRSEKGVSNGYASLDSGGKVPISQLPSSIMEYKGTWNAATNTPTLANGTGDTGDVYICNVAGTVNFGAGPITFAVGDYVIYSGTIWQRSSGAVGTVTSVAASITGDAIGITGSPVTTSGTLAFAFGGNSTQYINGAGNLITFPSIISQAANLVTEVYNKTGATLTKGTIVYINGGQGNLPTITKAIATGDSTSAQTFGIVQADITNNNNGYVVIAGRLSDIDTQAYTEGTQLYLSSTTAGTWTSTKQYAPAHLVYVGIVVRAHPTQGVVEVKIQNGYELDELHNVAAQTPSNNDGLFYESSTDLWKNKSIATILGYTPQAQLNGTGFVKASGTTITYDNSTYVTTDTFQNISASKTFAVGFNIASAGGTNQISVFANTNSLFSGSGGSNVFGFNSANNIYFGKGLDNGGVLSWNNSAVRYYTLPDATGTIALVGGSGVGTVTSVGLSSATSGVTIGSTPITTSGTITLAIDTASGSQQGLLSSTDWTTFNNKQNALTNPVTGTGTTNYLPKFTGTSTIGNSLVYDNGTNVGIGTASPVSKLQVVGGGLFTGGDYTDASLVNAMKIGYNTANNYGYLESVQVDATERPLRVNQYGGTTSFGGKVSIGSNTPTAFGTQRFLVVGSAAAQIARFTDGTNGDLVFDFPSATISRITAQYGTGGVLVFANGTGFNEQMRLNASGNLSIGNTNNTYRLDVTGQGRFTHTGGVPALDIRASDTNFALMSIFGNQTGDVNWLLMSGYPAAGDFTIRQSDTVNALTLKKTTGAATFSSSVTANSSSADNGFYQIFGNNSYLNIGADKGGGAVLKYNSNGNLDITPRSGYNTIFTSGNVGIGTTSPSQQLETTARFVIGNSVTGRVGTFGQNTATADTYITLQNSAGNFDWGTSSGGHYFYGIGSLPMQFFTNSTERMRITSTGQFIVGDTSLAYANSIGYVAGFKSAFTGQTIVSIARAGQTLASQGMFIGLDTTTSYFWNRDNIAITFGTNESEKMRITSGGDIGIGNTGDASVRLFVSGKDTSSNNYAALFRNSSGSNLLGVKNSGTVNMGSLPTSSTGLSSGDIWKDGTTLRIV